MKNRLFEIVNDSASDMPEEYYVKNNIELVKIGFLLNDVSYSGEDGGYISEKDFYDQVRKGAMPITYQINTNSARLHIEKLLKQGSDVLVITFSSGLSGTSNNFFIAAKELQEEYPERKIMVIDSVCASTGEGLFLDYIVKKADSGATLQETYDYAMQIRPQMCHYFTVDNLFHLHRGGRVSKSAAVIGTALNIKPILNVDMEGHLIPIGKVMGRKKSLKTLFSYMKDLAILEKGEPIFIGHGDCIEDANFLMEMVKAEYPDNPIMCNYISSVIGAHSGPGTMALFFRGKHR